MSETPEQLLAGMEHDLKSFMGRHDTKVGLLERRMDTFEATAGRPNYPQPGYGDGRTLADAVHESEEFKVFAKTGRGRIAINIPDFQRKAAILGSVVGFSTPGVVGSERVPGVIPAAIPTFRVRDLLRQIPTTAGMVDYVRVTGYTPASPVVEAEEKDEAALGIESVSEKLATLAHWVPCSRQVLQDVAGLQEAINIHLLGGLHDGEDVQLLFGDGTGENLNGLTHQAQPFDITLLTASDGYEYFDLLNCAIAQAAASKYAVDGIVVNPLDWFKMTRTKGEDGHYVLGNPALMTSTRLWGLPVSVTGAMTEGYFLVGAFATGAALYVRMDGVIEVSDSHADYFIRNKLCIRCESRELLATYKPQGFIFGQFAQSPI